MVDVNLSGETSLAGVEGSDKISPRRIPERIARKIMGNKALHLLARHVFKRASNSLGFRIRFREAPS